LIVTCRDFADFLVDYIDDTLPADVRQRFELHLDECPDCVTYLRQYRDTIRLTAHAGEDAAIAMPEELARAIVLASRTDQPNGGPRSHGDHRDDTES
jgi:anti-sigma factor RsiW